MFDKKISDSEKLLIALESLYKDSKFTYSYGVENSTIYNYIKSNGWIHENGSVAIEVKEISSTIVNSEYKRLFGTDVKEYNSFEDHCPPYIYDGKSTYYWLEPQCGGLCLAGILYKNNYSMKGDEVYVYMSYEFSSMEEPTVYGVYKYTFKKDSTGNYYFVKVEKVR